MDILRKMFKMTEENNDSNPIEKDEFRKPSWFDESDTDDELFGDNRKFAFEIFTNPMELQKHFEQQMRQIMEAVSEYEENAPKFEKDIKEEYLKPGFEGNFMKEFHKQKDMFDTDLDGEIYVDQLHSLMQRVSPEIKDIIPGNDKKAKMLQPKKKLSDEETIMGRIHGTLMDDEATVRLPDRRRQDMMSPHMRTPFGGVFEGTYQGPKMFRQSVVTKTVRKPDGSYETTKITQDSNGNVKTTTTRTVNGKSETVTSYNNKHADQSVLPSSRNQIEDETNFSDRNIYVSAQGYALPKNLW